MLPHDYFICPLRQHERPGCYLDVLLPVAGYARDRGHLNFDLVTGDLTLVGAECRGQGCPPLSGKGGLADGRVALDDGRVDAADRLR
jgi:hypothetical protein